MCKNKRRHIPLLLLLLLPILAEGQIGVSKIKETADSSIPKDVAMVEFISNRPDLIIKTSNSKIDTVYPEIYPEGSMTRYKVKLKLSNGGYPYRERKFDITVRGTSVYGEYKNKNLKEGYRYEVRAEVPELVIAKRDMPSSTNVFATNERMGQVEVRSAFKLEINVLGVNGKVSDTTMPGGFNSYKVVVPIDSLNIGGMVEPQLLVTVKDKSNNVYIDIKELGVKEWKVYEIYEVPLPTVDDERGNVVFKIVPDTVETWITFNGNKKIAKGSYSDFVRYGAYPYEVSASNDYHVDTGIIHVNGSRKEVPINLRVRYGRLSIQGGPMIYGATIYLDGEKRGTAPTTIERVTSGKYKLMVTKERCKPYEEEIYIEDGQTLRRTPELNIVYEHFVFTVGDDAEIWINGKLSGKGRTEGDYDGDVIVECKKEHHTSTRQEYHANPGATRAIQLEQPKPKVGNVNISSNPGDAQVFVDRILQKERTPILVSGLLEGKHELLIRKKGQADEYRDVEIKEGETVQISVNFQKSHSIKVRPNVQDYAVSVNGRELGKVKSLELAPGDHHVKVVAHGYEDFTKTVSVPGLSELRVTMQKKQYNVTVKCDDNGANVQRDGKEIRFNVNRPLKLDYGQHILTVANGELSTDLKVFIENDTVIEVSFANLQSGTESEMAAAQANAAKAKPGKTKEKITEKNVPEPKVESPSEPKVVIREERSTVPEQRAEEHAAVVEEYEEDEEGYEADDEESQMIESDEIVDLEPLESGFKYKDFSRWTLDINMATSSNNYVEPLAGGTFAFTGKRGWGFYISGYHGFYNPYYSSYYYYYGYKIYNIDNFDYQKSDNPGYDLLGTIGLVRRMGSSSSVVDIQFYLGAGALLHDTYVAKQRYVYEPNVQDYVTYTYLRKKGNKAELCIDAGLRFGLDHRTKFGWFNFTVGGMYVVGIDRFYCTGGISLGNAAVAGALFGYLVGIPNMY